MENLVILSIICALFSIIPSTCKSSPLPQQQSPEQIITFIPSKSTTNVSANNNDDDVNPVSNATLQIKKLLCRPEQTEYKGRCFQVLQPLPCADGEWLVEDPATGQGKCVENKCAQFENTGCYNGKCVKIRSEEYCPKGMRTYIDKSGQVDCDCKEGHIYNVQDGYCYEAYKQGPCKLGSVFVSMTDENNNKTTKTICKSNPCKTDGIYCNGPDAKCEQRKPGSSWMFFPNYDIRIFGFSSSKKITQQLSKNCIKFGSPCTPDGKGIFVVHPETNQPYCQTDLHDFSFGTPNTRIIGNVPILKCAPGSRRDILGNCRTPTLIDFS